MKQKLAKDQVVRTVQFQIIEGRRLDGEEVGDKRLKSEIEIDARERRMTVRSFCYDS